MKIHIVLLLGLLNLSPVLSETISPLEIAGFVDTDSRSQVDPTVPQIDILELFKAKPLISDEAINNALDDLSKSRIACAKQPDRPIADLFLECAGPDYQEVDKVYTKFRGSAIQWVMDQFHDEVNDVCQAGVQYTCYEMEKTVGFAVMHNKDPYQEAQARYKVESMAIDDPLRETFFSLKQNWELIQQLFNKMTVQRHKVVEKLIKTFRKRGLPAVYNYEVNPFPDLAEETAPKIDLEAFAEHEETHHETSEEMQSPEASADQRLETQDLEKAQVFDTLGTSSSVKQAALKQFDETDIRLNILNPTALFPVPSEEDLKDMSRADPDLELTSKQRRLLRLKRNSKIV